MFLQNIYYVAIHQHEIHASYEFISYSTATSQISCYAQGAILKSNFLHFKVGCHSFHLRLIQQLNFRICYSKQFQQDWSNKGNFSKVSQCSSLFLYLTHGQIIYVQHTLGGPSILDQHYSSHRVICCHHALQVLYFLPQRRKAGWYFWYCHLQTSILLLPVILRCYIRPALHLLCQSSFTSKAQIKWALPHRATNVSGKREDFWPNQK